MTTKLGSLTFKVDIKLDNAAFHDGVMGDEIARILRGLADRVAGVTAEGFRPVLDARPQDFFHLHVLRDINGNNVGSSAVVQEGQSDDF